LHIVQNIDSKSYFNCMKRIYLLLVVPCLLLIAATRDVKDYLQIKNPIKFANNDYSLTYSYHPSPDYYKQEYLPAGETGEKFNSMVLIDALLSDVTPKEGVSKKILELKKLKESNDIVNYDLIKSPDGKEYILDFILSENTPDGNVKTIERNIYRYITFNQKSGTKGLLVFAIATRAYGDEVTPFLKNLKGNRNELINEMVRFKTPQINIVVE
jgi:hypothetical protein